MGDRDRCFYDLEYDHGGTRMTAIKIIDYPGVLADLKRRRYDLDLAILVVEKIIAADRLSDEAEFIFKIPADGQKLKDGDSLQIGPPQNDKIPIKTKTATKSKRTRRKSAKRVSSGKPVQGKHPWKPDKYKNDIRELKPETNPRKENPLRHKPAPERPRYKCINWSKDAGQWRFKKMKAGQVYQKYFTDQDAAAEYAVGVLDLGSVEELAIE